MEPLGRITESPLTEIQKETHASLIKLFQHANFFDLFSCLSYLDLLSLAYALHPLLPSFGKRIPSLQSIVNRQLQRLGIETASFWKALQDSKAVLHGSFLLHCLLEPIKSGLYSQIFTHSSDIDLLEPYSTLKKEVCLPCLRRLYQARFPGDSKAGQKKIRQTLLGAYEKTSHQTQIGFLKGYLQLNVQNPHIRRRHTETNALSSFLCHFGEMAPEPIENYRNFPFERRLMWKMSGTTLDQVTIMTDKPVKNWLRGHVDFEFGKVCFDGRKLTIVNRRALIKRISSLPNHLADNSFMAAWERSAKATAKGFQITMTATQVIRKDRLLEREQLLREQKMALRGLTPL